MSASRGLDHAPECPTAKNPRHGCWCPTLRVTADRIRAATRTEIFDELQARCHALRHPSPCPWCAPVLHIVRGDYRP